MNNKNRLGKEAKETKSKYLAGEGALRQLITRSQSIEDISSIFEVLKSWRTYPGRPFSNLVEAWLFGTFSNMLIHEALSLSKDRSIALSCETQLLDVLAHRPLYGISVPSLRHARAIMKGILEPSKVINAEEESTKLQAALSLSQILDASLVQDPSATSSPSLITPSVASDLVMSSLLLATMLRTIPLPTSPTISKDDDSFINSSAFIHFLTTTSSSVTTLRPPTSAREYIWTNRALQSTKRLLEDTENGLLESLKQASILLNGEEEGEKVIDDPLAALQVVADHLGAGENLGENVRKKAGLL